MIRVRIAPEPPEFDDRVRQRGLSAIDEMVGRAPRRPHPGRRRAKICRKEERIPPDMFPEYWREAIDWMHEVYEGRCAYLAMYIHSATGALSVDHAIPKSKDWRKVYEWKNYRLCAMRINGAKGNRTDIIDPATCRGGWFALDLVGFQVVPGAAVPAAKKQGVSATCDLLNEWQSKKEREWYFDRYTSGKLQLQELESDAPFIARELRRQRRLRPGDT